MKKKKQDDESKVPKGWRRGRGQRPLYEGTPSPPGEGSNKTKRRQATRRRKKERNPDEPVRGKGQRSSRRARQGRAWVDPASLLKGRRGRKR